MDINRVLDELDALFAEEKTGEIEDFLSSAIARARAEGNQEAELILYSELIGFYRETGQYDKSVSCCNRAIALMEEMQIQGTIPYATVLLNIANAYRAAGLLSESLEYYNRVLPVYDQVLDPDDMYYASLYNNLSLLYQEMGDFGAAKEQLEKALDIVKGKADTQFEIAVTYANLANTCIELGEDDQAKAQAEEAIRIFEEIGVDDAHYSAALSALGSLYYMEKNYEEACAVMEKSRDCVAKYLGTENVQYERLSENIAIIRLKLGKKAADGEPEGLSEEAPSWEEPIENAESETAEAAAAEPVWEEPTVDAEMETAEAAAVEPALEQAMENTEPEGLSEETPVWEEPAENAESETAEAAAEPMREEPTENAGPEGLSEETPSWEEPTAESVLEELTADAEMEAAEAAAAEPMWEEPAENEELETAEAAAEPVLEEPMAEAAEYEDFTPGITGLELCRGYYEEYGRPMIAERFPEYEHVIAVGLVGKGSDCFGFDDTLSADHDFGPRFVMWVTKEVYGQIGEALQAAYEELPASYRGVERTETFHGRDRAGVMIIEEFYKSLLGYDLIGEINACGGQESLNTIKYWLAVQDYAFAAAVNGEVFRDDEGIFTGYRSRLAAYYPKAAWYRKIAQACAQFSQSGQYNLPRMRRRGQLVAAELAKAECVKQAMKLYYLLNRQYAPHDKWLFRGMPDSPGMVTAGEDGVACGVAELVQRISLTPVTKPYERALGLAVEQLAVIFANELERLDIIGKSDVYLDANTKELTAKSDALLTAIVANTPVVTALALTIAKAEFEAFDKVRNEGGRASCQNNWPTFKVMRMSQYMTWPEDMLLQYLYEFRSNFAAGRNMIEEKYARMMESTNPEEYAQFADKLPPVSEEKRAIIEGIVSVQVAWMEEFAQKYPVLAGNARSIHTAEDLPENTSYETYLRGELGTYSDRMLELYGQYIVAHAQAEKNIAAEIMENTVHFYGYKDLETANKKGLDQ